MLTVSYTLLVLDDSTSPEYGLGSHEKSARFRGITCTNLPIESKINSIHDLV
jgi:hypothetical protein